MSRCQRFMITSRVCIDMLDKFELKEIAINQNIASLHDLEKPSDVMKNVDTASEKNVDSFCSLL